MAHLPVVSHQLTKFVVSGIVAAALLSSVSSGATWTDLRGEHTINADLVGIWGEQAILRKPDGTRISIHLNALRSDSRIQAQKMNDVLVQQRLARVNELKKIAAEADAAAPKDLPIPKPASPYSQPMADMTPDAFMQHINSQAQAGHQLLVYYDSLPPTYRADMDELFTMATSKLDPTNWASLASTLQSFGDLVVTRQNWIFSHPRFIAASDASGQKLQDGVLALAGALQVGFNTEHVALEKLRSMKLRDYLLFQDESLAPYLAQLSQLNDSMPQVTVDSTKQDTAVLSVSQGALTQKASVTKVEGFWLPTDMSTKWQENMTTAKADLAAMGNGEVLSGGAASMVVTTVASMMSPLREAKDATQFHLAMESVFSVAQPMVVMIATAAGGMKAGGGGGGNAGYGNDYGMEGYESMGSTSSAYEGMDSGGGSQGPATNAMEASRRAAEAASRGGPASGR